MDYAVLLLPSLLLLTTAAALLFAVLWRRARRRTARAGMDRAEAARTASERERVEREGIERELDEVRETLEGVRESREGFLDLATHELRSPLSAILGYQELMADGAYGELDAPMAEAVNRIGRSARHLLHLIDGLVELSRIRAGSLRPELSTVHLGVLFASVAEAFRTGARERGLEPQVDIPSSLPSIQSDQTRLVRALDLLITSAIKHPAGQTISLRVTVDQDGVTTRVTGTEMVVREKVEDLAIRLGIRLAVVEGMARVLGGELALDESEDGVVRGLSLRVGDLATSPVL